MVAVRCNFEDAQETIGSCLYGCEYFLVNLASIISPDNTLISVQRSIVEKMLKHVDKEGVAHDGENITPVFLR